MKIEKTNKNYQATQKLSCGLILSKVGKTRMEAVKKVLDRVCELHDCSAPDGCEGCELIGNAI